MLCEEDLYYNPQRNSSIFVFFQQPFGNDRRIASILFTSLLNSEISSW